MKTPSARNSRSKNTSQDATDFSFSSGALYADKDEYVAKGLIFTINAVEFQEEAGFELADRWAVTVAADDGRPDEIITLQSNEKRDAELETASTHIAKQGPIPNTKLVKSGRAYYFRKVDTKST